MCRLFLIAAMLLISASARADGPRGLSLASNDEAVVAEQPKAAEAPRAQLQKADAPKIADQPKADRTKSASGRSEKPKLKRSPLEARVVDELHRRGIYW